VQHVIGWMVPPPSSVKSDDELRSERQHKVAELARLGLLRSERLRRAMLEVRREDFVLPAWRDHAYEEVPLPLPGRLATISCPHSYPLFYEALGLGEEDRFLEVGLGSGYGAALAREVVGPNGLVVSVEIDPKTFAFGIANLARAGYDDVVCLLGDGGLGSPLHAPFDRICVTAACDSIPSPLLEQLGSDGRLIAPVRRDTTQQLTLVERKADRFHTKIICDVLYVALQGAFGTGEAVPPSPALVVTARNYDASRSLRRAIRRVFPSLLVRRTGFRNVFTVEGEGDPCTLAEQVSRQCEQALGRVVAVVTHVRSVRSELLSAVAQAASAHIRAGESFAVRIHKRGRHGYLDNTPVLERACGSAVWEALERQGEARPHVDLTCPDVTIEVEVLGPWSLVGVARRSWVPAHLRTAGAKLTEQSALD
jgi:protein-L-isoaspartate(D-aspartate) O-methyltransferase